MEKTYEILNDGGSISIKCNLCNARSYNPNDVHFRFCGNCRKTLDTRELLIPKEGSWCPPFLEYMPDGLIADEISLIKEGITPAQEIALKVVGEYVKNHDRTRPFRPWAYKFLYWKSPSQKSEFIAAIPLKIGDPHRVISCFRIDDKEEHWLSDFSDIYIYTFSEDTNSWKMEHILISQ